MGARCALKSVVSRWEDICTNAYEYVGPLPVAILVALLTPIYPLSTLSPLWAQVFCELYHKTCPDCDVVESRINEHALKLWNYVTFIRVDIDAMPVTLCRTPA